MSSAIIYNESGRINCESRKQYAVGNQCRKGHVEITGLQ